MDKGFTFIHTCNDHRSKTALSPDTHSGRTADRRAAAPRRHRQRLHGTARCRHTKKSPETGQKQGTYDEGMASRMRAGTSWNSQWCPKSARRFVCTYANSIPTHSYSHSHARKTGKIHSKTDENTAQREAPDKGPFTTSGAGVAGQAGLVGVNCVCSAFGPKTLSHVVSAVS